MHRHQTGFNQWVPETTEKDETNDGPPPTGFNQYDQETTEKEDETKEDHLLDSINTIKKRRMRRRTSINQFREER